MNVLLVNPRSLGVPVVLDAVICRCTGIERKAGERIPPIGLAYIAAKLRASGHSVCLLDCAGLGMPFEGYLRVLRRFSPDLLVTLTSGGSLADVSGYLQAAKSAGALTALCGSCPSLNDTLLLRSPDVDLVVRGEPEATFDELAGVLEGGRALSSVRGLSYKSGDSVKRNPSRPLLKDLDSLPFPARDLLPNSRYRVAYSMRSPQTVLLSSRGCPFTCVFCTSRVFYGSRLRARSAENVADELEEVVHAFGVRDFSFQDDTFTVGRTRVLSICDEIRSRGLDVSWQCNSRVDTVDPSLLAGMKSAGCYLIKYGVESGDGAILKLLKKGTSMQGIRQAIRATKDAGIKAGASFILGCPWDTVQTTHKTISFAKELGIDYASFNAFTFFDGLRHGDFLGAPCNLGNAQVNRYLLQAYLEFYLRPSQLVKYLDSPAKSAAGGVNLLKFLLQRLFPNPR